MKTNWESATITTLDDKIIPYITNICKRDLVLTCCNRRNLVVKIIMALLDN
ncbi:hypothetical protein [Faecalibacillus intestinalis]|uniref:hypothetical protein n=1 Tax=Faecalibacillus intestinalis TaxID=1982626 RepID=UPI003994850D